MRALYVADVGDGLCAQIITAKTNLPIDCGSSNRPDGDREAFYAIGFFNSFKAFIISHFHLDHYSGIYYGLSEYSRHLCFSDLKNVYFPRVPDFDTVDGKSMRLTFMTGLLAMVGARVPCATMRHHHILSALCMLKGGLVTPVPRQSGDTIEIDQTVLEVVWPPPVVGEKSLGDVRSAIKAVEKACKEDPNFGELYSQLYEKKVFEPYLEKVEVYEESYRELEVDLSILSEKELSPAVKEADACLRKAANQFSLAFHEDNRLLFMGDACKQAIPRIVKQLRQKQRTEFYIYLTPHHGTHWDEKLRFLNCKTVIASNGKERIKQLRPQFREISDRFISTYFLGSAIIRSDGEMANQGTCPYWALEWPL